MKELAQTVIASYKSGVPVIIFDEIGGILHGIETLETITAAQVPITCLTIRGVNQQSFEATNLPECCEAARLTWLAGTAN